MSNDEITALALGAAALVLCYSVFSQFTFLSKRSSSVMAFSFAILTFIFLREHTDVLATTTERIVLAILAGLISLALLVKNRSGKG